MPHDEAFSALIEQEKNLLKEARSFFDSTFPPDKIEEVYLRFNSLLDDLSDRVDEIYKRFESFSLPIPQELLSIEEFIQYAEEALNQLNSFNVARIVMNRSTRPIFFVPFIYSC